MLPLGWQLDPILMGTRKKYLQWVGQNPAFMDPGLGPCITRKFKWI